MRTYNVLSRVPLENNIERTITFVNYETNPHISIALWRPDEERPFTSLRIYPTEAHLVGQALDRLQGPYFRGRVEIGQYQAGNAAVTVFAESVGEDGPALVLQRRMPSAPFPGRPIVLRGEELEALGPALDWFEGE